MSDFFGRLFVIVFISLLLTWMTFGVQSRMRSVAMEKAYFEGQKDAIEGDVRIEYIKELKKWHWTKSPWDDGTKFRYNPLND